jgi:hypothetical protein
MKNQGYSLGKQLALYFAKDLQSLCKIAGITSNSVWFLGRDCDVFHGAFVKRFDNAKYLSGLNRENSRKLQHRKKLVKWLKSIGVKKGDTLIDSGYCGSIYERIQKEDEEFFKSIKCVLLTANPDGFVGEPLNWYSVCGKKSKIRHATLALEHSPKREIIGWDETRRVPTVSYTQYNDRDRANAFWLGCVKGLLEGMM